MCGQGIGLSDGEDGLGDEKYVEMEDHMAAGDPAVAGGGSMRDGVLIAFCIVLLLVFHRQSDAVTLLASAWALILVGAALQDSAGDGTVLLWLSIATVATSFGLSYVGWAAVSTDLTKTLTKVGVWDPLIEPGLVLGLSVASLPMAMVGRWLWQLSQNVVVRFSGGAIILSAGVLFLREMGIAVALVVRTARVAGVNGTLAILSWIGALLIVLGCVELYSPLLRNWLLVRVAGHAVLATLVGPVFVANLAFDLARHVGSHLVHGRLLSALRQFVWTLLQVAVILGAVGRRRSPVAVLASYCPWVIPLLFVLPIWRSRTHKLRRFGGMFAVSATRQILAEGVGGIPKSAVDTESASTLGEALLRCVNPMKGGMDPGPDRTVAVQVFIAQGVDTNHTDARGLSALHYLCHEASPDIEGVRSLLAGGADPNLRDYDGETPLHLAANALYANSYSELTSLMLSGEWGTDPSLVSNAQKTPFMAALGGGRSALLPSPTWAQFTSTVAAADTHELTSSVHGLLQADNRGLLGLQLLDLLWDERLEPSGPRRIARRRWVFEHVIAPLVEDAATRRLAPPEKELLFHACRASAGPALQLGDRVFREGHREAFDEKVGGVMAAFASELDWVYSQVIAEPDGVHLAALPSQLLSGASPDHFWLEVSQTITGSHGDTGDLIETYHSELVKSGAVRTIEELCSLLQSGRNRHFPGTLREGFCYDVPAFDFWLHIFGLASVARHQAVNEEFQAVMATALHGLHGAVFTRAKRKTLTRVVAKARLYHDNMGLPRSPAGAKAAVARVTDVLRCSCEVPSPRSALAVCQWLDTAEEHRDGVRALRRKNGFEHVATSEGGYRDVTYNLVFAPASAPGLRVMAEVQILLSRYLAVKKRMHAVYRIARGDFG